MNIKKHILRKLYRHRVIGGKHTAIEHTQAGIPAHLLGEAKRATEELIKEGYVLTKYTSYGLQISLNPEKIAEIIGLIENN